MSTALLGKYTTPFIYFEVSSSKAAMNISIGKEHAFQNRNIPFGNRQAILLIFKNCPEKGR
ncbi:hypothetical protein AYO37_00855 [Opitutia bacterium SCGC AG-212-L18]|nr:hypothetical protein AYO37_00855 [Opitutae bacterium SCGC AG-212-L18]